MVDERKIVPVDWDDCRTKIMMNNPHVGGKKRIEKFLTYLPYVRNVLTEEYQTVREMYVSMGFVLGVKGAETECNYLGQLLDWLSENTKRIIGQGKSPMRFRYMYEGEEWVKREEKKKKETPVAIPRVSTIESHDPEALMLFQGVNMKVNEWGCSPAEFYRIILTHEKEMMGWLPLPPMVKDLMLKGLSREEAYEMFHKYNH